MVNSLKGKIMFGFRSDGKRIKYEDIMMKMTPHFMKTRNDASNQIMQF